MFPSKLKKGDEIRVISPARSMAIISKESRVIANKRFNDIGLTVSFSKNIEEKDDFNSSSIESRLNDLHKAFSDKNVKAIITTIGGFNSNQLLRYIDYKILKQNPKIFCGFSDITALHNSIYSKTKLVCYYGPHFSSFGMLKGFDYTLDYFKKCLFDSIPFEIMPSKEWSDDEWYKDQEKRNFINNKGYVTINEGEAKGTIIGGNLCTFNLLHGTEFMPSLKESILFIEDDCESKPQHFDRDLQSIIHQPGFEDVRGIIIGRFQKESNMTNNLLAKIIKSKKELQGLPIISNVDFGHTTPIAIFPIGGRAEIVSNKDRIGIKIIEH
jgi:muramoyltetrapeptide carboxypeptidase LdcA involved in peptidoglycan recycling